MINDWDYGLSTAELDDKDYQVAVDIVNSFFDKISNELRTMWEKKICILVDNSGSELFKEQKIRINCLNDALILNDTNDLKDKHICLENNVVLVFDDAIKTGNTIIRVLDSIIPTHPKRIIVVAIIASQDTLEMLKKKYEKYDITFNISKEIPGNTKERSFDIQYHKFSNKILDAYLKYICRPRQDEKIHPYLLIKFGDGIEKFLNILEPFDLIPDNDDGFKFKDRSIHSIVLKDKMIQDIINQICFKKIKFNSDLDAFIRIFYRGDLDEIILQPVLRRHEDSYITNPYLLDSRDYFIKLLMINYLIEYILQNKNDMIIEKMYLKCYDKNIL
jgi:hypothetical protein